MSGLQKPQGNAAYLLGLISKKVLLPERLTKHQRRICVRFLLHERKHSQHEIATVLQVHPSTVTRDKQLIRRQNENMFSDSEFDERKIAVEILDEADVACSRLYRKGKEKEALEMKIKTLEFIQSLGFVKRKPIEFDGRFSLQEILKIATDPSLDEGSNGAGAERPHLN